MEGETPCRTGSRARSPTLREFRGDGSLEAWVWRIVVNEARRS
jgi:hypothetical protein